MTRNFNLQRRRWTFNCTALWLATLGMSASHAPLWAQSAPPFIGARLLVVGDSMSAEYGLPRGSGWVSLLTAQLSAHSPPITVVNASVSGETTSGGKSRLPVLLKQHQPTLVILQLGGNDALRGLPLEMTEKNLQAMSQASKASGAKVLVVGMQVPPNYGRSYSERFARIFTTVAETEKIRRVPFLLQGIADDPQSSAALFQADRIHPNEKAQPKMLANVWAALKLML